MYKSLTTHIDPAACLASSRYTINGNFNAIYSGVKSLNNVITTTEIMSRSILTDAVSTIKSINTQICSNVHHVKLSVSQVDSDCSISTVTDTLYLHPYKGTRIALYNDEPKSWLMYTVDRVYPFKLINNDSSLLAANTSYDIFLSYENKTFKLTFIKWGNITNTEFIEGVCVLKGDKTKRYIGCVQTTLQGKTEINYTAYSTDRTQLKSFLWNYKNQTPKQVRYILNTPYHTTDINQWTRTAAETEAVETENNCSIDFIVGGVSMIDFEYQNFFESSENVTVNSGIAINTTNFKNFTYNTLCRSYPVTLSGRGSSTAQLKGNVPRGLHFLQTFDISNNIVSYNIIHNNIYKSGFTGIIFS